MWYHTNVVWNQADQNYDLRQICHSAFFKDRAKNVKVRHEKVAKNRQKWVQIFFGMSHMLNNDISNFFLFFTFFLLVHSRPCFRADFFKMTDLPKVIVSICLVSYNICMIPHVWRLTFGLNLSGAWGVYSYHFVVGNDINLLHITVYFYSRQWLVPLI